MYHSIVCNETYYSLESYKEFHHRLKSIDWVATECAALEPGRHLHLRNLRRASARSIEHDAMYTTTSSTSNTYILILKLIKLCPLLILTTSGIFAL